MRPMIAADMPSPRLRCPMTRRRPRARGRRHPRRRLGRPARVVRVRRRPPGVPRRRRRGPDGGPSSGPASRRSTARSAGSGRSGSPRRIARQGLGRRLTEATIDAAEDAGCRTLVLVATDAGRPLYERLGFEVQTWYRTMEAPGWRRRRAASRRVHGSAPSSRTTSPRWSRSTGRRPARTGRHVLDGVRHARRRPGSSTDAGRRAARASSIRAPWGGGATIAPDAGRRAGHRSTPGATATRPTGRGPLRDPRRQRGGSPARGAAGPRRGAPRG